MSTSRAAGPPSPESFESLSRRNTAAEILQSYEKLSWYATQRCESIVQTRIHFQSIIAGLTPADEEASVFWKTDNSPHPEKAAQEAERKRLAKGRVSEGAAGPSSASIEDTRRESGGGTSSGSKKRKSKGDTR